MSSHELSPYEADLGRTIRVGWDRIGTYFVSISDATEGGVRDVLFAGADRYDISEVDTVLELIAPYAPAPADLRETLIGDRATEGYRSPVSDVAPNFDERSVDLDALHHA